MPDKQVNSRYQLATNADGTQSTLPFINLDVKTSDKYVVWKQGVDRTDKISNLYYGTPYWGSLIMMANPQYGGLEYDIPNNTIIRIPYPLQTTLTEYYSKMQDNANKK